MYIIPGVTAKMMPMSSANNEFCILMFAAKQPMHSYALYIKIPTREDALGFPMDEPFVFHFIHLCIRGRQKTSRIWGVLGGWVWTRKALRIVKSRIEGFVDKRVWFPIVYTE